MPITHKKAPLIEPEIFLLQGNSANHCATPIQFNLTEFVSITFSSLLRKPGCLLRSLLSKTGRGGKKLPRLHKEKNLKRKPSSSG